MAGLVTYGSSDEEDNVQDNDASAPANAGKPSATPIHVIDETSSEYRINGQSRSREATNALVNLNTTPLVGPVLGPTMPADAPTANLLERDHETNQQSPYSANRAILRDLTLPTLPNYDIPPSPPGSPVESTTVRFKHFLDLKKQGVHFNEKLARSAALKNPSLMQKLMDFSDIDEAGQYGTTLPMNLWNPDAFPEYAYKEELAKSQNKILKKKEEEKGRGQRESVDFVSASTPAESISRSGTPGTGGARPQKSAAERIMAGLERGRSSSPFVQGVKRKSRFDS